MGVVEMLENIQKVVKDYVAKKELENDYISNVVIKDMNLANMDFSHKHFNNCLFINCNFNGSNFSKAYLNGVNLENCNLNNCIFTDSSFVACKLKMNYINNSNFMNSQLCSMHGESVWYTNHFKNTSFQNANLADLKLDNSDFRNADFTLAQFFNCEVENCDFRGAVLPFNISQSSFNKSNLQETNLKTVFTHNVDFENTKKDTSSATRRVTDNELEEILKSNKLNFDTMGVEGKVADLSFVDLSFKDLSGYSLYGVNLQNANLYGANLSNCKLESANLEGANLDNANLENTSLECSNLKNASLKDANLKNASFNSAYLYRTIIPNIQEVDLSKVRTPRGFVSEELAKEILGKGTAIHNIGGEQYAINPEKSNYAIMIGQDYQDYFADDLLHYTEYYVKSFAFINDGDNIKINKNDVKTIEISYALNKLENNQHEEDCYNYGVYCDDWDDGDINDYYFPSDIDWDKIRKDEAERKCFQFIKQEDFHNAYSEFIFARNEDSNLNFMKEVIKEKGVNTNILHKAINAVIDIKEKWNEPAFKAKLIQDTLKTDEYKKAFEAGQGKTAEIAR